MIDPILICALLITIFILNKLPWFTIFRVSEESQNMHVGIRIVLLAFGLFFAFQCLLLALLTVIDPDAATALIPWQFALGGIILLNLFLLNWGSTFPLLPKTR
ncbi:MAG: hypothetical protein JW941_00800 [Candidatus Coatesbacteria bacterium]|nr:hypothetical protein [Candidatus Coatesbacteria bacterium]